MVSKYADRWRHHVCGGSIPPQRLMAFAVPGESRGGGVCITKKGRPAPLAERRVVIQPSGDLKIATPLDAA
jgi:hypothetical protein